jgi:hypothetical protein
MLYVGYFLRYHAEMQPLMQPEDREGATGRALPFGATIIGGAAAMTVELCLSACQTAGYVLAGTEYADECCKLPYAPILLELSRQLSCIYRVWQ